MTKEINSIVDISGNYYSDKCIQEAMYFGHSIFTNICTGDISTVQWGIYTHLFVLLGLFLLVIIAGLMVTALVKFIFA